MEYTMIRIFADSGCDLSQKQAAALGVTILPLHVRFKEQEYLDGVIMTPDEFYAKLGQLPAAEAAGLKEHQYMHDMH